MSYSVTTLQLEIHQQYQTGTHRLHHRILYPRALCDVSITTV